MTHKTLTDEFDSIYSVSVPDKEWTEDKVRKGVRRVLDASKDKKTTPTPTQKDKKP
jgi:hypothetical protein